MSRADARAVAYERCGGICERCGLARATNVQHRRPRGMGGSTAGDTESPANYAWLCGSGTTGCHGEVESRRLVALVDGWLVPQGHSPVLHPVRHWLYGWCLLNPDGTVTVTGPPDESCPCLTS